MPCEITFLNFSRTDNQDHVIVAKQRQVVFGYIATFFFFLFHFHRTLSSWACGSLREPRKHFSNSLFVHSLLCQITHSFLNGFQPNLCQHFPHECSTSHAIFSLK